MQPFCRMDRYWFLTTTFYGNWLPGDPRGFVSNVRDRRPEDAPSTTRNEHDRVSTPYDRDLSGLNNHAKKLLKCDPIRITLAHAKLLCNQFHETAQYRGWELRPLASWTFTSTLLSVCGEIRCPKRSLAISKRMGAAF